MRVLWFSIFAVAVAVFTVGCGREASYSLLSDSQRFEQTQTTGNNKLDVLFIINAEPSMSSFQAKLVASFSSFMSTFSSKGFDFRVAVSTSSAYTADPTLSGYDSANVDAADFNDYDGNAHSGVFVLLPTDLDLFGHFAINAKPVKNPAGQDGRSFSSFRQSLLNTRPINNGFLRSDSFLAVVIVDNQDDFSGNGRCVGCNVSGRYNAPTLDSVDSYIGFLDTLTGTSGTTARYNVSAMTQIAAPCQGGSNMTRIMELATKTNGILGDICQTDFGASMAEIADQIASLSTQFFLDRIPNVESIVVKVDGVQIENDPTNGWTYDADANSVRFHGAAVPEKGAIIDVKFDPLAYGV